jgi:hypothetical protein
MRDSGRVAWMDLQEMAVAMRDDAGIIPGDIVQHPGFGTELRAFCGSGMRQFFEVALFLFDPPIPRMRQALQESGVDISGFCNGFSGPGCRFKDRVC